MIPSKCVGALLVRNEAAPDRYLKRVLANAKQFCDDIVVLDDASTDATVQVCRDAGCIVHEREGNGWWGGVGRESSARSALWAKAAERASPEGWVYVADADHELVGITPVEFRRLLRAENVDAWACPLWDCWDSDEQMRVDGYWQAHWHPRVWLARAYPAETWNPRGIHAGHLPERPWRVGLMPPGTAIRHLGYIQEAHRVDKRLRYMQLR